MDPKSNATNETQAQVAELMNHCFGFADSLAIRSAIELHISDIIHAPTHPMTIPEIASKINSLSPDFTCLERVMRVLARKKIFTVDYDQLGNPVYGSTPVSNWLRHDFELSLAPLFLTVTHPTLMAAWHEIGGFIKGGSSTPFEKAHGQSFWENLSNHKEFNEVFYLGLASLNKTMLDGILEGYKDEFCKLDGTLVDVGGGIGDVVAEIVKAHPHIKGINFDLPHVVAIAPPFHGVTHLTHVGGDFFKEIPKGDMLLLKWILHDWGDEECIKILKNCQKAIINASNGKIVVIDIVLQLERDDILDDARFAMDLHMMALFGKGKERTENEWKNLFIKAGFTRYNIISIPALVNIIEVFLD